MKQKQLILIAIVIALILCGGVYIVKVSQAGKSGNVQNKTNTCQTDSDCRLGEYCIQSGPIVLDPVTRKPLTQKTCQKNGTAVPF